jgi:hypothetical protein
MEAFVAQSVGGGEDDESVSDSSASKEVRVRRALFRIGDVNEKLCDDSPVFSAISATPRAAGEFDYKGKLVQTDGDKTTKLTKLFKRRDNEGKLIDSLKKMKLDE